MSEDTLDRWIGRLNEGDGEAVERVFLACEPYLRISIRRRLGPRLRVMVDSTDILQSVFADFLVGSRDGRWRFADRSQLLAFLRRLAWRRLADHSQKYRHDLQRAQSLAGTMPQELPQSALPRPSQVAQGREFWECILRSSSPAHREIVRLRRDGLRLSEIASRTGLHEGSIRRILYDLARRLSIARRADLRPADEDG